MIRASRLVSLLSAAMLSAAFSTAQAAAVTPLTATQVLNQMNVVTKNTINSTSHVDGRTYAGGSVSGGEYGGHISSAPASSYAGLTAGGAVSNVKVNGGGAVVAGSVSNSIVNSGGSVVKGAASNSTFNGNATVAGGASNTNFNGAQTSTAAMKAAEAAASSTNFNQVLANLSTSLSGLTATGSTVDVSGNKATFNAKAGANGVAVFDLSAIDESLFKLGEFQFNLNGASTVIFNTDIISATIGANFLGGAAQAIGSQAIWNFYKAENLTINNQFGGSVLAVNALLTNNQNIEGGVYVEDLVQKGEIHLQAFSGSLDFLDKPRAGVPEPGSIALVMTGLLALGCVRLRRKFQA